MTLNTSFVVAAPAGHVEEYAEQIYTVCRQMLHTPDHVQPKRGEADPRWSEPGTRDIDHPLGIGLAAWLTVQYRPEGPKVVVPDDEDEVRWALEHPFTNGFGSVQVSWDTSYGYRSDEGLDCSQLHAAYIVGLGNWCDPRELPWQWQNEYTGEWHMHQRGLQEFAKFHDSSVKDWFSGVQLAIGLEASK